MRRRRPTRMLACAEADAARGRPPVLTALSTPCGGCLRGCRARPAAWLPQPCMGRGTPSEAPPPLPAQREARRAAGAAAAPPAEWRARTEAARGAAARRLAALDGRPQALCALWLDQGFAGRRAPRAPPALPGGATAGTRAARGSPPECSTADARGLGSFNATPSCCAAPAFCAVVHPLSANSPAPMCHFPVAHCTRQTAGLWPRARRASMESAPIAIIAPAQAAPGCRLGGLRAGGAAGPGRLARLAGGRGRARPRRAADRMAAGRRGGRAARRRARRARRQARRTRGLPAHTWRPPPSARLPQRAPALQRVGTCVPCRQHACHRTLPYILCHACSQRVCGADCEAGAAAFVAKARSAACRLRSMSEQSRGLPPLQHAALHAPGQRLRQAGRQGVCARAGTRCTARSPRSRAASCAPWCKRAWTHTWRSSRGRPWQRPPRCPRCWPRAHGTARPRSRSSW